MMSDGEVVRKIVMWVAEDGKVEAARSESEGENKMVERK